MRPDKPLRLYQAWRGNNRFFCGGRLIFGPDAGSLFLSTFLILGPAIAFSVETALFIKHRIEHKQDVGPWYAILAIGIALTVLDMIFFYLTSSRDPGIIPRNSTPPDCDDIFDINTPSMEWVNGRTPHLRIPRVKDVVVNGHAIKVKYCDTCLLYRPPRASHCSICNNCVQRFDHHCPWLGQCIGIRNYRFFYMFITTSTILCFYVFVFSWINIVHRHGSFLKAMSDDIIADILIIYCFISFWFVGGLSVFHLYLIFTNQTTYENFRYRYDKKDNPYNRGKLENFKEVFFSKITSSLNDFRSFVKEDECIEPHRHFMGNIPSDKEKIDIEMGSIFSEEARVSLPELLRNLSNDDTDNEVDLKPEGSRSLDMYTKDARLSLPGLLHNLSNDDIEDGDDLKPEGIRRLGMYTEEARLSLPEILSNLSHDDPKDGSDLKLEEGRGRIDINPDLFLMNQEGREDLKTARLEEPSSSSTTKNDANLGTMLVEEGHMMQLPQTFRRPSNASEMVNEDQGEGVGASKSNILIEEELQESEISSTDNGTDAENSTCKLIRSNSERVVT